MEFSCSTVLYHCDNTTVCLLIYVIYYKQVRVCECVTSQNSTLDWIADCIGSNWKCVLKKVSIHTEWLIQTCCMVNCVFAAQIGILTDTCPMSH